MPIQDLNGNLLLTTSSPMIGFIPAEVLEQPLSLRIYRFLIQTIRDEDQSAGNQFVERFLEGPQQVWATNDALIKSVPILWSVTEIPDRFLQFLKNIVGWTIELRTVTDALDDLALRRLISASVPFWKTRGPEDAIEDILRLTTAARLRIWNWFDYRIIIGEMAMGEEHKGFDPEMISLPGPPNIDENRFNIRIVDDGTLNRELVRELAALTRPSGERIEISYIGFLDLFNVDDDDSQWEGSTNPFSSGDPTSMTVVQDGTMIVSPTAGDLDGEASVNIAGSTDWSNYVVTWRARGEDSRFVFYKTGDGDMYVASLIVDTNVMTLVKFVAGVFTPLGSVDMLATFGVELKEDLFYAVRVEATPEGGSTRIRVYFDAELVFNELDASHVQGTIGIGHGPFAGAQVELDEAEMFFNPLTTDTIDINS